MTDEWDGITLKHAKSCVGEGWHPLLEELYENKPAETKIVQVKEKWGGLRYYTNGTTPEFNKMIVMAEEESYSTCEFCGEGGELRGPSWTGWVKTLCDDCAESYYSEGD